MTAITIYEPINVGDYIQISRNTDDYAILDLWASKRRGSDTGNTADNYTRIALAFLDEVDKPIQAVIYPDLEAWSQRLKGAINTRRTKVYAIKSLFTFAHTLGYLRINPGVLLQATNKEHTKHRKVLTEEEVINLVNSELSPRDEAILRVLYSSGCRVSELINLRWQDVIEQPDGRAILVIRGKGGKTRESGISAGARRSMIGQKAAGAAGVDPVFLSNRKKAMHRTTVNWLFYKLRSVTEKDPSPHWMRHSHISHALARSANPVDVQEQVGHSSLEVTTGYAHKQRSSADYLPI